jgi:hypothetical protein
MNSMSLDMTTEQLKAARQRDRESDSRVRAFDPEAHARREDRINREIMTRRVLTEGQATLAQAGVILGDTPGSYGVGVQSRRMFDEVREGRLTLKHGTLDKFRDGQKRLNKATAIVDVDELRRWVHEHGTPADHVNAAGLWQKLEG